MSCMFDSILLDNIYGIPEEAVVPGDSEAVLPGQEAVVNSFKHTQFEGELQLPNEFCGFNFQNPTIADDNLSLFAPAYTEILARTAEEGIFLADIEQLKMDLEYLLSHAQHMSKQIKYKRKLLKHVDKGANLRNFKNYLIAKKRYKEKRKFRKMVHAMQKASLSSDIPRKRSVPTSTSVRPDSSERFWLSVDHYCSDISKNNEVFVDSMIKECSKQPEVTIPEVDEHFSSKATDNSLDIEQRLGSAHRSLELTSFSELCDTMAEQCSSTASPLKHKLQKALTEEKESDDEDELASKACLKRKHTTNPSRFHKALRLGFLKKRHLKNKFKNVVEDEIVSEIRRSMSHLHLVNDRNVNELTNLRAVCVKDLKRQEIKESLDKTHEDMMTTYEKIMTVKDNSGQYSSVTCTKLNADDAANATVVLEQESNLTKELMHYTHSFHP